MFSRTWRLGRIAGVEVRIDSSWTVIAFLVGYSFFVRFLDTYPSLTQPEAAALAVLAAALFFGSVLLHELAHAAASRAVGIPVQGITLFLFGGATHARVDRRGPREEFIVTAVGPLSSFALAAALGSAAAFGRGRVADPISGTLALLAWINLVLAVFNLLPGFPLDGGRILRSAVWAATGSLTRATKVASVAGRIVGYLLAGVGLVRLLGGNLVGGLWLAAIGWFLAQAARASGEEIRVRAILETAGAEDVMAPNLVSVPAGLAVRDVMDQFFMRYDHAAFPVTEDGRSVGLLTLRAIRRLPEAEWSLRTAREAMTPLEGIPSVRFDARMDRVVEVLEGAEARRALVVRDGVIVGIITPSDVARWLRRRQELG